ncbi:hypothetical protein ACWT_2621 [Actinoplanes sp. SE50]|uniref:hypothetical protein n=1 Tax=unclassified Actinoplanes TaxID=2626549 RepID=UPI00023ECE70|nr:MULTISPECIES: hypothetical protein [unclassified Actinoplanes]AEV83820.1 hypothetical protein ACPL_2925 [Actinoplanes sp. SE50/110]ATO82036.1 hypothetical protein ACWT_2621 [Actinoplanes sp. SE50]SLL99444.1 hypothetical protein ACSP50_2675 [Actinoplanes sp. SE50/110]
MPTLRQIRVALAHRLAERRAHRRLSEELAAFRTAAERTELDLVLGRHTAEETRAIEAILSRQDAERRSLGGSPATGVVR